MIARGKLLEKRGMKKFARVRVFAFDAEKNFERRRSARRNRHRRLLSQMVAWFWTVPVHELLRGHPALALDLNLDQLQCRVSFFAASDDQARTLDRDLSRRQANRTLRSARAVYPQRLPLENRERP